MKSMKTLSGLFLATLVAIPIFCMAEKCEYKGKTSVFVSYANASTNTDLDDALMINLGFDGNSPNQFIMDTGSCGIVASPDIFQPGPNSIKLGRGETHYTNGSFERSLTGNYWTATQQIYDEAGNLVATSNVPVLQVTEEDNGGVITVPTGFALMGIGFGREGSDQPPKTPSLNAFLNLTSILVKGKLRPLPEDWVNGYVISAGGAELGLTANNTKGAGFIKLTYWAQYATPKLPEWMPMSATTCANGVCGDGMSVMDTGIDGGIINPPGGSDLGTLVNCPDSTTPVCVDSGNVIGVYYPNINDPVAFYNFTVGQTGNPMQPGSVAVQNRPTVYWNTSRHFLGGMNQVYDNTNGYAGFIWTGNTSSEFGFVIPTKVHRCSSSHSH